MNTSINHPRVGRALPAKDVSDSAKLERRALPTLCGAVVCRPILVPGGAQ